MSEILLKVTLNTITLTLIILCLSKFTITLVNWNETFLFYMKLSAFNIDDMHVFVNIVAFYLGH